MSQATVDILPVHPEGVAAHSISEARGASPSTLLRRRAYPLSPIFEPRSIAVIGATETTGSVGRAIMQTGGRKFPTAL